MSGAVIEAVAPQSPAERAGILVGDHLVSVNGRAPVDIIEYQQLIDGAHVEMVVRRRGEPLDRKIVISKHEGERLGVAVDSAVFDRIRTCDNHCSFCFIYQLPKGMRKSLYVKDDDFRLSFLYGNFTTLTRFTEFDLERILEEALSPLYVSIHTTSPDLRADMLRNPRGATSLRWLRALLAAGVEVHGQVVVCPGVNDGAELVRTLEDVLTEYPLLETVSLVPLGVSRFSTESEMRTHTVSEARAVVALAEQYRALCTQMWGRPMIFASDEFYLVAGLDPPRADELPSLDQAENGVGMVAAFRADFENRTDGPVLGTGFFQSVDGAPAWGYRAPRAHASTTASDGPPTILTGEYAAPLLRSLLTDAGYVDVDVEPVTNNFFGGNIKVAGLLTGSDFRTAIDRLGRHRTYLVPDVCLSEDVFLDGTRISELDAHVMPVPTAGGALRRTLDDLLTVAS